MANDFLVSTEWLAAHLNDPDLRVFDTTTLLIPDPQTTFRVEAGREAYREAHVVGAGFLDLQEEFSDNTNSLRFSLPSAAAFAEAAAAKGIGNNDHVVLYATNTPMWATRFWWMFRTFGHERVSVLDGGFAKWQREGRPVSQAPATYEPAEYSASLNAARVADRAGILGAIDHGGACLLNSLGRDIYSGENVSYGRAGHIKSSKNVPWSELLDSEGCFLDASTLHDKLDAVGAISADRVITYCGGGIAASMDLFALALLGLEDKVALYDNSLSEWARDEALPMEVG